MARAYLTTKGLYLTYEALELDRSARVLANVEVIACKEMSAEVYHASPELYRRIPGAVLAGSLYGVCHPNLFGLVLQLPYSVYDIIYNDSEES